VVVLAWALLVQYWRMRVVWSVGGGSLVRLLLLPCWGLVLTWWWSGFLLVLLLSASCPYLAHLLYILLSTSPFRCGGR
jgi:hypothetical protein